MKEKEYRLVLSAGAVEAFCYEEFRRRTTAYLDGVYQRNPSSGGRHTFFTKDGVLTVYVFPKSPAELELQKAYGDDLVPVRPKPSTLVWAVGVMAAIIVALIAIIIWLLLTPGC